MVSLRYVRASCDHEMRMQRLQSARRTAAALSIERAREYQRQKVEQGVQVRSAMRQQYEAQLQNEMSAVQSILAHVERYRGAAMREAGALRQAMCAEALAEQQAWQGERTLQQSRFRLAVASQRVEEEERQEGTRCALKRRVRVAQTERARSEGVRATHRQQQASLPSAHNDSPRAPMGHPLLLTRTVKQPPPHGLSSCSCRNKSAVVTVCSPAQLSLMPSTRETAATYETGAVLGGAGEQEIHALESSRSSSGMENNGSTTDGGETISQRRAVQRAEETCMQDGDETSLTPEQQSLSAHEATRPGVDDPSHMPCPSNHPPRAAVASATQECADTATSRRDHEMGAYDTRHRGAATQEASAARDTNKDTHAHVGSATESLSQSLRPARPPTLRVQGGAYSRTKGAASLPCQAQEEFVRTFVHPTPPTQPESYDVLYGSIDALLQPVRVDELLTSRAEWAVHQLRLAVQPLSVQRENPSSPGLLSRRGDTEDVWWERNNDGNDAADAAAEAEAASWMVPSRVHAKEETSSSPLTAAGTRERMTKDDTPSRGDTHRETGVREAEEQAMMESGTDGEREGVYESDRQSAKTFAPVSQRGRRTNQKIDVGANGADTPHGALDASPIEEDVQPVASSEATRARPSLPVGEMEETIDKQQRQHDNNDSKSSMYNALLAEPAQATRNVSQLTPLRIDADVSALTGVTNVSLSSATGSALSSTRSTLATDDDSSNASAAKQKPSMSSLSSQSTWSAEDSLSSFSGTEFTAASDEMLSNGTFSSYTSAASRGSKAKPEMTAEQLKIALIRLRTRIRLAQI